MKQIGILLMVLGTLFFLSTYALPTFPVWPWVVLNVVGGVAMFYGSYMYHKNKK